jgi:2-keto-4-pentenoate hydratase
VIEVPAHRFIRLGVECELAVVLGAALPAGGCTLERAASAVGSVHAAVELVDNRYEDFQARKPPVLGWVADDFFHCGLVLSTPMPVEPLSLDALRGAMWVANGDEDSHCVGEGNGSDIIDGHPLNSLVWLANSEVAHSQGGLPRGWVVSLGSVTQTAWVDPLPRPGAIVRVKFSRVDNSIGPPVADLEVRLICD